MWKDNILISIVISYDRNWSKTWAISQLVTIPAGFVCQRLNKKKMNCPANLVRFKISIIVIFDSHWKIKERNSFVPLSLSLSPIPQKNWTDIDEASAWHVVTSDNTLCCATNYHFSIQLFDSLKKKKIRGKQFCRVILSSKESDRYWRGISVTFGDKWQQATTCATNYYSIQLVQEVICKK